MTTEPLKIGLISDFNVQNLASYLENDKSPPSLAARTAPYGQARQILLDSDHEFWSEPVDFILVWTTPEGMIESFNQILVREAVSPESVLSEVEHFGRQLVPLLERTRALFVPLWSPPATYRGIGPLDLKAESGIRRALLRMNLRLLETCEDQREIHFLDSDRWVAAAGAGAYSPKLWYMAKIPFANEVLQEAAADIKAALRSAIGKTKKLLVLDLDNTLWGGIVGDVGWQQLRLGGHDPIGEGFRDFQRALKALQRTGVLLAIVSKNEEDVALEAIRNHPEMELREQDFVGWRIDWGDKAANLADIVAELNLGLDAVVFLDDNPVERARVRDALPEVLVPDWPSESLEFTRALEELRCFDRVSLTEEDRQRTSMYLSERRRATARKSIGSLEEWLVGLGQKVVAEPLSESNLPRATQLLNKTNQMNLSTRRLTANELTDWARGDYRLFWTLRVSDRFGDYGLCGLVSMELEGKHTRIVDYVLSCRVMGRKIEEALLHLAVSSAISLGADELRAVYLPTEKNRPCLKFFRRSGMDLDEENMIFRWPTSKPYPLHECVELEMRTGAEVAH